VRGEPVVGRDRQPASVSASQIWVRSDGEARHVDGRVDRVAVGGAVGGEPADATELAVERRAAGGGGHDVVDRRTCSSVRSSAWPR
jgi:hypothetical protein